MKAENSTIHRNRRKTKIALSLGIFGSVVIAYILSQFLRKYTLPKPTNDQVGNEKTTSFSTYELIPNRIIDAVISIEDKRFRTHPGIDIFAIGRATYQTVFKKNTQGASTIDQQTIKLIDGAFNRSRTRKLYEIWMAVNLQFHYSKKQIVLTYINNIPFSHGIKGRSSACSIYFHKPCDYLSDGELSYLFAIAQLGTNPYKEKNQKKIYERASILCDVLRTAKTTSGNTITTEDGCAVLHSQQNTEEQNSSVSTNTQNISGPTNDQNDLSGNANRGNEKNIRPIVLYPFNEQLDPKIQLFLDTLPLSQQNNFSLEQYNRIEKILETTQTHREVYDAQYCCVVAVDTQGNLISMNTCSERDEEEKAGKVNSCTDPRQVGSAIKPFLYAYAFNKKGLHASDLIIDEPISYDLGDGSIYSPKNFDLTYRGKVSIGFALGNSLNVPAIKTLDSVGVENFLGFLQEQLSTFASGHDNNKKDAENVGLSLALGTYEISPYAFTQLRRFFLQGETPIEYTENAKEVVTILSNPTNRAAAFGQDSFLNLPGRAVKTGTSRKFIDARVCGVNNEKGMTLCLRMGNINNQAMKGPSSEIGSFIWNVIAKGL